MAGSWHNNREPNTLGTIISDQPMLRPAQMVFLQEAFHHETRHDFMAVLLFIRIAGVAAPARSVAESSISSVIEITLRCGLMTQTGARSIVSFGEIMVFSFSGPSPAGMLTLSARSCG